MGLVKPLTYGRMGNFLFQVATAAAYAWRNGLEFTVPSHTTDPKNNPIYLQHLVNPKWDERIPKILLREKGHGFQHIHYNQRWGGRCNIILDGYWQSEKYFVDFRERILSTFAYPWTMWKGMVSFHVRRGDYLQLAHKHPPVPFTWMQKAMALFPGYVFVFFSDDLEWCRAAFGQRDDVRFSFGKTEVDDLIGMSCCEHNICSASTFSWWGAWLNQNPNKRVVMPDWWFTPGYQGLDTSHIVPQTWERIGL